MTRRPPSKRSRTLRQRRSSHGHPRCVPALSPGDRRTMGRRSPRRRPGTLCQQLHTQPADRARARLGSRPRSMSAARMPPRRTTHIRADRLRHRPARTRLAHHIPRRGHPHPDDHRSRQLRPTPRDNHYRRDARSARRSTPRTQRPGSALATRYCRRRKQPTPRRTLRSTPRAGRPNHSGQIRLRLNDRFPATR